jgi:hypothetical protein
LRTRQVETGRRAGLPVDWLSALDLNTPADWQIAEAFAGAAPKW